MLYNIFGRWINPKNICFIRPAADNGTLICFPGISVTPDGDESFNRCYIKGKNPDEVAEEINKQIWVAKQG